MAKIGIRFFVVSCSSDGMVNTRFVYVHGERNHHLLPTTSSETKKRLLDCQKEMKCNICDAEIHECRIERKKNTLRQNFSKEEIMRKKGEE